MKQYDCIVYGKQIYGLTVALYLARKMRKVLVIQDTSKFDDDFETINITDPENKHYHFEYNSNGMVSGANQGGLLYEYLDDLGLLEDIQLTRIDEEMVVNQDNVIRKRIASFDQFKVYLVRYYPKSRDRIHRFFVDLERHFKNYVQQYMSMLRNVDYTLSSLMIEWGDYSLDALLHKYFESEELIREFLLNNFINGQNPKKVNSYSFFSNYFLALKQGAYYLEEAHKDLCNKMISKLKLINPDSVVKTRIKSFVKDKGQGIDYLVDKDDIELKAKLYFIEGDDPRKFYSKYFEGLDEDLDVIDAYFPNMGSNQRRNTLYLAINQHPVKIGIDQRVYYFQNNPDANEQIIKLFNYSLYRGDDQRKKQGMLCVDFSYDDEIGASKEIVLQRLYEVFPKLKQALVSLKEGQPKPYLTMISDRKLRKNLTINEMIEIESFEHIQVFDNLYVGSPMFRPEAGFFGVINQAIVVADKIEDRLYYGENDDLFHYLDNEEIMTMLKHHYDYRDFEEKEIHINFYIGKSRYFIRTKGKHIVCHYGKYNDADLSIYTTNDRLSNLLLKKVTFNEVLEEGSLKYRGDKDLLFKAVTAFKLDDYQEYNQMDYKSSKYRYLGAKFLFAYFGIYFLVCLLSNYVNAIYFYPPALALAAVTAILKIKHYEEIYWFDIFINVLLLIGTVLAIFWPTFNQMRFDDPALGIMALALMISVFINKPVVYNYTKFDENIDYRSSILFKVISNGLTFVWGFLFLAVLVGTYITGERYVSVLYNLYFVGIFMMYYYPTIYIRTNIKR